MFCCKKKVNTYAVSINLQVSSDPVQCMFYNGDTSVVLLSRQSLGQHVPKVVVQDVGVQTAALGLLQFSHVRLIGIYHFSFLSNKL